jgi:hypothetical protein
MIMKNSQGSLEALAALCGTQSDAQAEARKRENHDASSRASHGNTGSSSSTAQVNQEAAVTTSQQSSLQGLTPQQWQHALAAAAALQQTQSQQANGVSPALAQSLLLPGLPTQGLANSTMEQFALHRYLQQAKVSVAQQAMLVQSLGGFSDPNHALVLALAGTAQQLHWQSNGELAIVFLLWRCPCVPTFRDVNDCSEVLSRRVFGSIPARRADKGVIFLVCPSSAFS